MKVAAAVNEVALGPKETMYWQPEPWMICTKKLVFTGSAMPDTVTDDKMVGDAVPGSFTN